jgi:hypothetical protein
MLGLTPRRLVYIGFIVAVVFLGRQYIPPYFSRFQFGDDVRQTVKYAAASHQDPEAVRKEILRIAEDDGVDINPSDVQVTRRGYVFTVDIDYAWPIDLKIYKHDLNFHISESGEVFGK